MKNYIHARLGDEEKNFLAELKKTTGETESSLVKQGLRLIYQKEVRGAKTALSLAGKSVGKFKSTFKDLSSNKKHLETYVRLVI